MKTSNSPKKSSKNSSIKEKPHLKIENLSKCITNTTIQQHAILLCNDFVFRFKYFNKQVKTTTNEQKPAKPNKFTSIKNIV